ncbi:hypothetical protein PCASD_12301 [Puccinia coronata f. sp. avenae]|uniref:Uncharacterized protein n=1 Tax=Puccinia coronata f. sp. avenae TaxID=200324 RepID=A0A2N5UR09_9BASI|nr:hypothetical protein PCASD_12301 [Puccinia coronata f. sp. avenae]
MPVVTWPDWAQRPNHATGAVLGPLLQNRRGVVPLSPVTSPRPPGAAVTLFLLSPAGQAATGDGAAELFFGDRNGMPSQKEAAGLEPTSTSDRS